MVFIVCSAALCVFPPSVLSRVILYDVVAVMGRRVMLRAETKGRVFTRGGELVEFFVNEESIGRTLSGGDGVAFKPFAPKVTGLHQIKVSSGAEEDTGLLLSLGEKSSIVFIDVESSLFEGRFARKPRQGSREAIEEINQRFPIVFLQRGFVGVRAVKAWLKENQFIELPVVPWKQGKMFDKIVQEGLRIKAIVADPEVIESASKHKPLCFSFRQSDNASWIKDWEEISRKLR